jgi:hypothetical protein
MKHNQYMFFLLLFGLGGGTDHWGGKVVGIFRRYVPGKSKCAKHSTRPWKAKNIRAEALMFLRSWLHGTKKIFPAHTDERFGKTIASSTNHPLPHGNIFSPPRTAVFLFLAASLKYLIFS